MEPLPEARELSTNRGKQRRERDRGEEPPESAENSEEREIEEKSSRDSSTTLRPRQNAIPTQSLLLSFYSPRWEGRYISLHYIYSLSFRTEIRLNFLSNECLLPRIFKTDDLYLTMYNTTKLVPTCKGRFMHFMSGFHLGTVFSTTARSATLCPSLSDSH